MRSRLRHVPVVGCRPKSGRIIQSVEKCRVSLQLLHRSERNAVNGFSIEIPVYGDLRQSLLKITVYDCEVICRKDTVHKTILITKQIEVLGDACNRHVMGTFAIYCLHLNKFVDEFERICCQIGPVYYGCTIAAIFGDSWPRIASNGHN